MLHQTIIGLEAKKQLKQIGEYPDVIIGCAGGGSNFAGLAFPFVQDKLNGKKISIDFLKKIIQEFPEVDLNWLLRDDDQWTERAVNEFSEEYKTVMNNEQIIVKMERLLQELKNQLPENK